MSCPLPAHPPNFYQEVLSKRIRASHCLQNSVYIPEHALSLPSCLPVISHTHCSNHTEITFDTVKHACLQYLTGHPMSFNSSFPD
jgi:hypothetical protein